MTVNRTHEREQFATQNTDDYDYDPAMFDGERLAVWQPKVSQMWSWLILALGFVGTIVTWNGGWDNTLVIADGTWRFVGLSIYAVLIGIISQAICTMVQFVYSTRRTHPAWLASYGYDCLTNALAYVPLLGPLLGSVFAAGALLASRNLGGPQVLHGGMVAVLHALAWAVVAVIVAIGTAQPEQTLVRQRRRADMEVEN